MGDEYSAQSFAIHHHAVPIIDFNHHVALRDVKSTRTALALGGDVASFLAGINRSDRYPRAGKLFAQALIGFFVYRDYHLGAVFDEKRQVLVIEDRLDDTRRRDEVADRSLCQFLEQRITVQMVVQNP